MDLFKKGNYVDNPYNNFFEICAKNSDKKITQMNQFSDKVVLVVNVSPFDKNSELEFKRLDELKSTFKNKDFEILAFPSTQLDNKEMSDEELYKKLNSVDYIKNSNNNGIRIFNRVYLNGGEISEVFKYCYRNSPLFMYREGKSMLLKNNFSKFLIARNGIVFAYYTPDIENKEIEQNIDQLLSLKKNRIPFVRNHFIKYNKYY